MEPFVEEHRQFYPAGLVDKRDEVPVARASWLFYREEDTPAAEEAM